MEAFNIGLRKRATLESACSAQLPEAVRRAGKEQQRTVQTLIILHEWGELVDCLKQWIVTPAADASR
jgi:hypothetical protein